MDKILVKPRLVPDIHKFWHYIKYLGIEQTTNENDKDVRWRMIHEWYKESYTLPEHLKHLPFINKNIKTVEKDYLEGLFIDVFNYSSFVDPMYFRGCCVQKSIRNAVHDGEIIQCPIQKKKSGKIYQKLIDTRFEIGKLRDIRVVIMGYSIPTLIIKEFNSSVPFGYYGPDRGIYTTRMSSPENWFSKEEVNNILQFCKTLGFEYGELDVLRSNETGRIYIVDANPTPGVGILHQTPGLYEFLSIKFKESLP